MLHTHECILRGREGRLTDRPQTVTRFSDKPSVLGFYNFVDFELAVASANANITRKSRTHCIIFSNYFIVHQKCLPIEKKC